jgi:hypothetical protein
VSEPFEVANRRGLTRDMLCITLLSKLQTPDAGEEDIKAMHRSRKKVESEQVGAHDNDHRAEVIRMSSLRRATLLFGTELSCIEH